MVLEKERMLLFSQSAPIEEKRDPIDKARREYEETAWPEYEKWAEESRRQVEDQINDLRREVENEMQDEFQALEDQMWELNDQRNEIERQYMEIDDAFEDEREQRLAELDEEVDNLREQSMAPLEDAAQELDEEIEEKWISLAAVYDEQEALKTQIKEVEKRVRVLDRQAEFGVLNVISGALENAEEMEKQGGIGSFDSFLDLPIGGGSDGPGPGDGPDETEQPD